MYQNSNRDMKQLAEAFPGSNLNSDLQPYSHIKQSICSKQRENTPQIIHYQLGLFKRIT